MNAQIVIVATEEAEGGGGLDLLIPPLPELIGGIIAFAIVFLVVWRFAAPAMNRMLEARQQAIGGQLAEAEKAKAEAESLLADYRTQLAEARTKGNEVIEEARAQAEQMRADIISRAEAQAAEIVAKAREDADNEMTRALADARRDVANLSIDLAEKVVGGSLDRAAQMGLVERYIADLERE
ncbi:MAG TPA: F0F1 ATP synthase subunit B [Acidimicrobiia bacterium]|jgi:F-type H+-transporting ATPase subunit b|nr:F0F1 ATP synthase subunit B [Acidimicrobiia bacterium]